MSETKNKRGGPNRGQGRPPVKAGEVSVTVCLRMTEGQRDKLERLGKAEGSGKAEWMRQKIDRAKEPKE